MAGKRRDLDETRGTLERWLGARLGARVEVSDLAVPRAGFSNETILGTARWAAPEPRELAFVVRVEPSHHQLFVEPDVMLQANVMLALEGKPGVPVPHVRFTETDPSVLGAPFFVMEQVAGRVPPDVPSWHVKGWTTELPPGGAARLYDNALAGLVALHAVDWHDGLDFLQQPGDGSALDRFIAHVSRWYEWSAPSRRFRPEVIETAMAYVLSQQPDDPASAVLWGDARVGNIIFADDLSVAAMLDWEGAVLGPPAFDLGWWLMFEEFFTEAQGFPRLPGVPDRAGTIARYEELAGHPVEHLAYHEVLAQLVFVLINSRLADLAIQAGAPPERATKHLLTTIGMLEGALARAGA